MNDNTHELSRILGDIGSESALPYLYYKLDEDARMVHQDRSPRPISQIGNVDIRLMAQLIDDESWQLRYFATSILENSDENPATDLLLARLKNEPNSKVFAGIIRSLGALQSRKAVPLLKNMLTDTTDIGTAVSIINALGLIGDPDTVPALIREFNIAPVAVIKALAKIGGRESADFLLKTLHDKSDEIKIAALDALKTAGTKVNAQTLCECLTDKNAHVRNAAVKAIGRVGDFSISHKLAALLGDPDNQVSANVIKSLADLGYPNLNEVINRYLKIKAGRELLCSAIYAAGRSRGVRFVPGLIEIINTTEDYEIKAMAIKAVGNVGDASVKNFIRKIYDEDPQPHVRIWAAYALVRLDPLSTLKMHSFIIESLWNKDEIVARQSAEAIVALRDLSAVPALLSKCREDYANKFYFRTLERVSGKRYGRNMAKWTGWWHKIEAESFMRSDSINAYKVFAWQIQCDNASRKKLAAKVFGECRSVKISKMLQKSLRAEKSGMEFKLALVNSLGRIGYRPALPDLFALLDKNWLLCCASLNAISRIGCDGGKVDRHIKKLIRHKFWVVRWWAAYVMGKLKCNRMFGELRALYEVEKDDHVKRCAAWSIGLLNSIEAKEYTVKILSDSDIMIRRGASLSLWQNTFDGRIPNAITKRLFDNDKIVRRHVAWTLYANKNRISTKRLVSLIEKSSINYNTQLRLVNIIENKGKAEDVDALINLLSEGRLTGSVSAALGDLKALKAEKGLILAMDKGQGYGSPAWALGRLKSPSSTNSLIKASIDTNNGYRELAIMALGVFREERVISHLIHILKTDVDPIIRKRAIDSLKMANSMKAILLLMNFLEYEDSSVSMSAFKALRKLTGNDFNYNTHKWYGWWAKNKSRILKEQAEKERIGRERRNNQGS